MLSTISKLPITLSSGLWFYNSSMESGLSSEIEFLRKQVEHLTNLLHDYQEKYPPLAEKDRASLHASVTPPWHVDQKLVSPLMVEYEATVATLTAELEKYKHQYNALQKHVDQLICENTRLTDELQHTLEEKLPALISTAPPVDSELSAIDNLQTQLSLAVQEKDACNDLVRASQREVHRLEEELSELRRSNISNSHWQHLQDQHQQMKLKYTQTISQLNQELRLAQEDTRRCKNEAELSEQKLLDFKKGLSHQKDHLNLQERGKLIAVQENVRGLQLQLETKNREISDLQCDLDSLNDLVDSQLTQIGKLARVCKEKEGDILQYKDKVKEAIQTAEEVVLEKTEMSLALKNYQSEVDRLREELSALCDQAGKKTKEEVDKVQGYNDVKIKKLTDNIRLLESENGTLKAEMERALREKRSVESELEKVYQEGMKQAYEDGGRYDQLSKRACEAERERDELKGKLRGTEAELTRLEMRLSNDKLMLNKEIEHLAERLTALQKDFDKVNDDRVRHLQEAKDAEELANSVKREAEAKDRKHNKEMICMEHSMSMKQTDFETRIRAVEEAHRKTMNQLHADITSQQRSTNQWKDEYHLLSDKWEKTVQSLRIECNEKDNRITELNGLLRETKDRTIEAETMMKDYTNQMRKIEMRTKEAERRAAEAISLNVQKDRKLKRLLIERQHNLLGKAKHAHNAVENTFRMSEMGDDLALSPRSGSPSVLDELSINKSPSRSRRGHKNLFADDLDFP
ncbi:SCLT1 [Bugula neritina]|uniref:SCLT1 n=1 Tax=Bugula neritina TaxID=10212 RepID=A0A7J7KTE3_BUGNE|nr:SCLT1 [Bugula neritina]